MSELTKQERKELDKIITAGAKWLQENGNPHCMIVIEQGGGQFLVGEAGTPVKIND